VQYEAADDADVLKAFADLSRLEGIIPAFETAHAFVPLFRPGRFEPGSRIVVNLSGRGDKDMERAAQLLNLGAN